MSVIRCDLKELTKTKWHEYLVRFAFGGLITAATGLIAKRFGPGAAGLFLAFPAIFPATVTLLQKHTEQQKGGEDGRADGKEKAGDDALGAVFGSLGLIAFGAVIWCLGPSTNACWCLVLALGAWAVVSIGAWKLAHPPESEE